MAPLRVAGSIATDLEVRQRIAAIEEVLRAGRPEVETWRAVDKLRTTDRLALLRGLIETYRRLESVSDREWLLARLTWFLGDEAVEFLLEVVAARNSDRLWELAVELLSRTDDPRAVGPMLDVIEQAADGGRESPLLGAARRYLDRVRDIGDSSITSRVGPWLTDPKFAPLLPSLAPAVGALGGRDAAQVLADAYLTRPGDMPRTVNRQMNQPGTDVPGRWIGFGLGMLPAGASEREVVATLVRQLPPDRAGRLIASMMAGQRGEAAQLVEPLLDDPELARPVRRQLVASLALGGSGRVTRSLALDLAEGTDGRTGWDPRQLAAFLGRMDPVDPHVSRELRARLAEERDPTVRLGIAAHLARGGSASMGDARDTIRRVALGAMEQPDPRGHHALPLGILAAMLPDPLATGAVVPVLESAADRSPPSDPTAALAVLDALARRGTVGHVDTSVARVVRWAPSPSVRAAAVRALCPMLPDERVQGLFVLVLRDADETVADAVVAGLVEAGLLQRLAPRLLEEISQMRDRSAAESIAPIVRPFVGTPR